MNINNLVRPNILKLSPYKSARSEWIGGSAILLDANENPWGDGLQNRYPDPYQSTLRKKVAQRNRLIPEQILFGNGSDELIDLLVRVFCEPKKDQIVICPPTFGMYGTIASINDIEVKEVPLKDNYELDVEILMGTFAKILFLPNPNSPTGNIFSVKNLEKIIENFSGIVVLDEAYIDFSNSTSWVKKLDKYPNLVILQTFSKYWALAGYRIGMLFANTGIISFLSKIKPPYNLNNFSASMALEVLENEKVIRKNAKMLILEREKLKKTLEEFSFVKKIYSSQANFLWGKFENAWEIYEFLKRQSIIIRKYTDYPDFLRISVGLPEENNQLIKVLRKYKS